MFAGDGWGLAGTPKLVLPSRVPPHPIDCSVGCPGKEGTRIGTPASCMSASADAVKVGEPVTFTIAETNNQPFDLYGLGDEGVGLRDSLPANVDFVSATPSQGTCTYVHEGLGPNDGGDVWCNLGTLPSGATAYIDVVVIPTEPGTITNTAIDIGESQTSASVEVYPS